MIIENGELNCYLDRIQLCKYDIEQKGPNMDAAGNFECMYPRLSDGKIEENEFFKCTDIILNTGKSDEDYANAIVKKLKCFVNKMKVED